MSSTFKRVAIALMSLCILTGFAAAQMGGKERQKPEDEKGTEEKAKEKTEGEKLPWNVDELKKSIKKGSRMKMKIVLEETNANGNTNKSTTHVIWECAETSDEICSAKRVDIDQTGTEEEWPVLIEVAWDKYMAEYLNSKAKVTEEKIKVGAGEFTCKLYTTTFDDKDSKGFIKIWFIKEKPGYMAKYEASSETEGGKGHEVRTLEELK